MSKSMSEIVLEIGSFINTFGGERDSWYVGTVGKPWESILIRHNLIERAGIFICLPAEDAETAVKAKIRLITSFGTDGELVEELSEADYVYAFMKNEFLCS